MASNTRESGYFSGCNYIQRQTSIESLYSYALVSHNFGPQPQFEDVNYDRTDLPAEYYGYSSGYSSVRSFSNASATDFYRKGPAGDFEEEPPLMEELGINFNQIIEKTVDVLNPLKETNTSILQDGDLSGPFIFCLMFGTFLLFSGKLHFGYTYGIGMLGCIAMYTLLNLMSETNVSIWSTISVLGYCLMPMVVLSGLSVLSLRGMTGTILSVVTVLWCSMSASKLFVTSLEMHHQQLLIAYPCALLYGLFALLTVF